MDFNFSEAEERFRREVRSFLQQEIPPDWEGIEEAAERDESWAFAKRFNRKLGAKGWLSLAWPTAFGGQGRSQMENLVFKEEMTYFFYRSPAAVAELDIVAPALMAFGSEKQKRELLPLIARGEAFFALGYTEPETGSDLSSLRTRAAAAGDDFIINGQKTFISAAHRATHCWLAARTDLEAPKHRGISLFALEMPAPGITVRPRSDALRRRDKRRPPARVFRPAAAAAVTPSAPVMPPTHAQPRPTSKTGPSDYSHVFKELKRIGVLTGLILVFLVGLSFFLR